MLSMTSNAAERIITACVFAIMPRKVAEILAIILGLWATVTPLALWVAWTQTIFLVVLGSGCLSAVLCCVLQIATNPTHQVMQPWVGPPNKDVGRLRALKRKPGWREHA